MDREEAHRIIQDTLQPYRAMLYGDLVALIGREPITGELTSPRGTWYQYEIEAHWDDKPHGNVRVSCAIDDGRWRAYCPLLSDFIKAPDGSFMGR